MRKTSVYLSDEDSRRLAAAARIEGRSQADILREAIATYTPKGRPDRNLALLGCVDGPNDSIAALSEEELLEGFGE